MWDEVVLKEVQDLIGRDVQVVKVLNGYAIEYFNFNTPPPPVGDSPEHACELFIKWFKENTDATNNPAIG